MAEKRKYFNIHYLFDVEDVHRGIAEAVAGDKASYICVADGNILTMVHKNMEYRQIVDGALFSICDSNWVPVFLKRIYGLEVHQYCGSQIFDDLLRRDGLRMYFLGAHQTVLDALKGKLAEVNPAVAGMEFEELPFCNVEDFDYELIAEKINSDNPDIIWLSLGAPKQEIFASKLIHHLKRGVVIPVGAVFNFRSGLGIRRAPAWMVKCHIEFVYRIFKEPEKQIRRCWNIVSTLPAIIKEEKHRTTTK